MSAKTDTDVPLRLSIRPRILSHPPLQHSWRGLTAHILRESESDVKDSWVQESDECTIKMYRFRIEDLEVKKDGNVVVWGYFNEGRKTWWNCVTPMALVHANTLYGSRYAMSDDEQNDDEHFPPAILPATQRLPRLECSNTHVLTEDQRRKLQWAMRETKLHTKLVGCVPKIDEPFQYTTAETTLRS